MIRWLVQTIADHPDLSALRPPMGLLTEAETAEYATYQSPHRRRDRLLGRWTAKQLVQRHIAATQGFTPALDAFSVLYNEAGAPIVSSDHPSLDYINSSGSLPLALTISHSHGYACSALTAKSTNQIRIGVDIELVEPRSPTFAEAFFSAQERAKLNAAPPSLRELLTTMLWSVKEATLKATDNGFSIDPRQVECVLHATRPRHWTPLLVSIAPHLYGPNAHRLPLRVWWRALGNRLRPGTEFVLAIAAYGANL